MAQLIYLSARVEPALQAMTLQRLGWLQKHWGLQDSTPNWFCGLAGEEKLMYSSFGASCSEVEINMLTGERRVLRADIMLDAGNSLSPAIDAGQASSALISLHQHHNVVHAGCQLYLYSALLMQALLQLCNHVKHTCNRRNIQGHCLVIVKTSFQSECGVYMA